MIFPIVEEFYGKQWCLRQVWDFLRMPKILPDLFCKNLCTKQLPDLCISRYFLMITHPGRPVNSWAYPDFAHKREDILEDV